MLEVRDLKKKILYCISILIYRVLLDVVYVYFISPSYAYYMGLTTDISVKKLVWSYVLTVLVVLVMQCNNNYLSVVLLNVQLIVTLIPMLSLYSMSDRSTSFVTVLCLMQILQCIIVRIAHKCRKSRTFISLDHSKEFLPILCCGILMCSLLYSLYNYGLGTLAVFNLDNIYNVREGVGYSFPFSYLVPWCFKVVCLFGVVFFLEKKRYVLAALASLAQIYFYLVYANKTTLFAWALVVVVYVLVKYFKVIQGIIWGLIAVLLGSSFIYVITGSIHLLSYLVRRTLFVPAVIKFAYYEFFSQNELLNFADNSIGHLFGIQSPYDKEAPKIIAAYLGEPDSHCNTGYWGDAYANFGWIGIVVFTIILVIIFLMVEKFAGDIPKGISYPLLISLFYNLNDGALLTWILGGGGALVILCLWLYRNINKRKKQYAEI